MESKARLYRWRDETRRGLGFGSPVECSVLVLVLALALALRVQREAMDWSGENDGEGLRRILEAVKLWIQSRRVMLDN